LPYFCFPQSKLWMNHYLCCYPFNWANFSNFSTIWKVSYTYFIFFLISTLFHSGLLDFDYFKIIVYEYRFTSFPNLQSKISTFLYHLIDRFILFCFYDAFTFYFVKVYLKALKLLTYFFFFCPVCWLFWLFVFLFFILVSSVWISMSFENLVLKSIDNFESLFPGV